MLSHGYNIKVEMHQSCRKATGYGLEGIGKVRRYCPDDAISCCMHRKSEVLQQPIRSHNDYGGITCLILMLLKKCSQSLNGWQTKLCLEE